MKFSDNLRNLRLSRHMTQMELARGVRTSQSSITAWENGTREPDFKTIQRLAEYFNVAFTSLLPSDDNVEDDRITRIVDSMKNNPDLCMLFDAQRTLSKEDIETVFAVVRAINRDNGSNAL